MKRNHNMSLLKGSYLFPEINKRKREFLAVNPKASLISLGIGDTTDPIPESIASCLADASLKLKTHEGYSGYGPEQGGNALREKIAAKIYGGRIHPDELFISD